ncbi:MAG: biopolymer transporter ExbD [Bradymonadaceae bacterium]|nr:biopolymer transporter ExbD [Lujinxingiaceae bacterium]
MNFRSVGKRRVESTLEITPLIDVVFLLLIFFLITTTFAQANEAQIPINLPEAVSGEDSAKGERVVLMVTATGEVVMDEGVAWQGDALREKLDAYFQTNPDASILLKGDVEASHGRVVELLDLVKQVGFKRVNLVISRPSK